MKTFNFLKKKEENQEKKEFKTDQSGPKEHFYFRGHECSITTDQQYGLKCGKIRKFIMYLVAVRSGDIRARNIFRSYAALSQEWQRQFNSHPFSIHPFSRLRLAIETLIIFAFLPCSFTTMYYYVESDINSYCEVILLVLESLYSLTIITNFFTGYVVGTTSRLVVLDLKKTAWRYVRTWLIVDLFIVSGVFRTQLYNEQKTNYILYNDIIVSMKILRLPSLYHYTSNVLTVLRASEVTKTIVELTLLVSNYLMWNVFFQFTVEYIIEQDYWPSNPRACSWLTITQLWNGSVSQRMAFAVHRAVGMLRQSSNMNLLNEEGCFEYFYITAWLIGKLLVIHCVVKYMIMMVGVESAQAQFSVMANQVEAYMDQRRFPDRLKKKILKFYAVRFQTHFISEHRLMKCVSGQLREDIIMQSGRQLVNEVPFLKQLPRSLLLQIGIKLRLVLFLAGDIIFKINYVGDCLYFIDKGTVAIYSETGKEICHLQDGDFFGEIALVMHPRFRTASAVAVTNCELFRLDRKDFESSIAVYPTVYEEIKKVAFQRMERTKVMDEHHKAELRRNTDEREQ